MEVSISWRQEFWCLVQRSQGSWALLLCPMASGEKGICLLPIFVWVGIAKGMWQTTKSSPLLLQKNKKNTSTFYVFVTPIFLFSGTCLPQVHYISNKDFCLFFSLSLPFLACVIIPLTFPFLHLQLFLVLFSWSFAILSPALSYLTLP